MTRLILEPLTAAAFAPFGDVIELDDEQAYDINDGTCRRHHDLARLDLDRDGGRPCVSLFVPQQTTLPLTLRMLERHPLGSQAFVPRGPASYAIVVAPSDAAPVAGTIRAFISDGSQGVNYHAGVWHHPLISLTRNAQFVVIDRAGPGANCDEVRLDPPLELEAPA